MLGWQNCPLGFFYAMLQKNPNFKANPISENCYRAIIKIYPTLDAKKPTSLEEPEEPTYWKRPWCWERLKAGGEGDNRGWDGWMASLMRWTWVWVDSRSWWWTGKPGVLQSMGSQRVGHNWATELTDWTLGGGNERRSFPSPRPSPQAVPPEKGNDDSLVRGSGLGPPVEAVHVEVAHRWAVRQDLLALHAQGLAAQAPVPGLQVWWERSSDVTLTPAWSYLALTSLHGIEARQCLALKAKLTSAWVPLLPSVLEMCLALSYSGTCRCGQHPGPHSRKQRRAEDTVVKHGQAPTELLACTLFHIILIMILWRRYHDLPFTV